MDSCNCDDCYCKPEKEGLEEELEAFNKQVIKLTDEIVELKAENAEMAREVERLEELNKEYFEKLDEIHGDIKYFLRAKSHV